MFLSTVEESWRISPGVLTPGPAIPNNKSSTLFSKRFPVPHEFSSSRIKIRPRRLRRSGALRDLVAETQLQVSDFVFPLFIMGGQKKEEPIMSMPGISRLSLDLTLKLIERSLKKNLKSFALFPVLPDSLKDSKGCESWNPKGLFPSAIREIKKQFPEVVLFTDVALDPYSSDGHDGFVQDGEIVNDITLELLGKMSLVQAEAGADFVAPSDMMDGRVGYLRQVLDAQGFENVGIMSYSAKYASSFYGPFREALDSAPKFGDKKTYQMDYRNSKEALREVKLDLQEGADIVMVKPALSYLDIIQKVRRVSSVPVAAYNVSGEYALVKLAAEKGLMSAEAGMVETLTSIKRAGADIIFSYFALEFAEKFGK